jgi:UDP-2,3-diacylglucosamine hydrolase
MNDEYYFLSDVHLGMVHYEHGKEQEDILVKFFYDLISRKAKELIINGDFFDSWIEYRQVVPKGHYRVLSAIYDLVKAGVKITYLAGNHDFWRGNYFYEEFGVPILHHHVEREINGKKFFIHHGDGLAYKDTGYKVMRVILRNRVSQFLYSLIHPDIGLWLAKHTSSTSRGYTSQKDYSKRDGLMDTGIQKVREGFHFAVMGHRHKPVMVKEEKGCYINLGDWMKNFSYGVFSGDTFTLRKYYDFESKTIVDSIIDEFKA